MDLYLQGILAWLALPSVGLPAVFAFSFLAATILPVGSEPILLGYLAVMPQMFWVAIGVATVGNTLGGLVSYGMGAGGHTILERWRARQSPCERLSERPRSSSALGAPPQNAGTPARARAEVWVRRFGPAVLLLAWLPVVGDPLCAVAGWLRLSFWQCALYMAIGKGGRYLALAWLLGWAISPP